MIYIIEVGAGLKYPRKIHLNTQSPLLLVLRLTNCPKRPSLDRSGNNATTLCLKVPINSLIGQKTISPHVPICSGGPANFGGIFRLYLNCAISRKPRQKSREITDV